MYKTVRTTYSTDALYLLCVPARQNHGFQFTTKKRLLVNQIFLHEAQELQKFFDIFSMAFVEILPDVLTKAPTSLTLLNIYTDGRLSLSAKPCFEGVKREKSNKEKKTVRHSCIVGYIVLPRCYRYPVNCSAVELQQN